MLENVPEKWKKKHNFSVKLFFVKRDFWRNSLNQFTRRLNGLFFYNGSNFIDFFDKL